MLAEKIAENKKKKENEQKLIEAIGTMPQTYTPGAGQGMLENRPGSGYLGGQVPLEGLLATAAQTNPQVGLGGLVSLEEKRIAASKAGQEYNQQQITDKGGKVWWADPRNPNVPTSPVIGPDGKQMEERIPPGSLPSVGRNFDLPILQQIQTHGWDSLTPNQKKAWEQRRAMNPLQQLIGGAVEPELTAGRENYPEAPQAGQRKPMTIYKTPKGLMRWTGTGWQPVTN